MEIIKHEIFSQTDALLKTQQKLLLHKEELCRRLQQPFRTIIFMGCGSSYMLSCSGASIFSLHTDKKSVALAGGEVLLNPQKYINLFNDSLVIVPSRSGETSEVIFALQEMKKLASFCTIGIFAAETCTLKSMMDFSIEIPWAFDKSVCQTRNISNFYYVLAMLYAFYKNDIELENSFSEFIQIQREYITSIESSCKEIAQKDWTNVTVLADGEVSGIATEGGLAFSEISIMPGEHFNLLDYRHGPIVVANSKKLIIALLNPNEDEQQRKLIIDLRKRGSFVITLGLNDLSFWESDYHINLDSISRYEVWALPFINLCQVLAFHKALACGHDPDMPEGLDPYIKL